MQKRGRLVIMEGGDGVGKTTLTEALATHHGFVRVKRPDRRTPTGQLLDKYLKNELRFCADPLLNERAAQMVFACNNLEGCQEIEDLLAQGIDVVMDRGSPSANVYFAVGSGTDGRAFIAELNQGTPEPDLVVVLDLSAEEAAARAGSRFGEERNDSLEIQRAVRDKFREFYYGKPNVHFLDAAQSFEVVLGQVLKLL